MPDTRALRMLEFECRALLTRLDLIEPFAVVDPMVVAAAPSAGARYAVDRYLSVESRRVRKLVESYLVQLRSGMDEVSAEEQARRLVFLRMRFNGLLADLDTFGDALTQRSQTNNGVWLAGLDVAASDGLAVHGLDEPPPPVMCYLDRGHGAAIRRARTRLVTGDNPVAILRIPRERMVGGGIGSSLLHEVGHQAAAMLDLLPSLRAVLQAKQLLAGAERRVWRLWELWISEIAADFWAVSQLGITATFGLISVVSLPRVFVFRVGADDPHPVPWIRVLLSSSLGEAVYPHPQWAKAAGLWRSLYPLRGLEPGSREIFKQLEDTLPELVGLLVNHRPDSLRGRTIPQALEVPGRSPSRLRELYERWRSAPEKLADARPTLALAVLGQARADGRLGPENEARVLEWLFRQWALRRARREASPAVGKSGCRCRRSAPATFNRQELGETYG
jgi:hypothetical protein